MDRQCQRATDLAFYYAYRAKSLILGEQLQTEQKLHQLEEFKEFNHLIRSTTEDVLNFLHVVYDPNKWRISVSFNMMLLRIGRQ
jgi:hypothetical protein